MALDFPASAAALWAIYDKTGIRPEWLVPVLSFESGLSPAADNGVGYYGLNQIQSSQLQAMGITPGDYVTWAASRQLSSVVSSYMAAAVAHYGPLRSGIRVYQANFYPASLAYAKGLDDTIVANPNIAYTSNKGLDPTHDGTITPRDLGIVIATQAAKANVKAALAATYAARPYETMTDPVLGQDFSNPEVLVAGLLDPSSIAAALRKPSYWIAGGILGAAWWASRRFF